MRSLLVFQIRSLLTVAVFICATVTSACAQEKPKRMIQGPSEFIVVPDSLGENEDGIAQITFGGISPPPKPTEYASIGAKGLKDAPPLPTGYTLFKDLVFKVKTEALVSGSHLTIFKVSSADGNVEFGKLDVLHLKYDALSPTNFSWEDATVFPNGWDEHFHHIPKKLYDAATPDFKSKRIAAITDEFGIFAIAFAPESEPQQTGPFPEVVLKGTSSPEPAHPGQEVTHTLVFSNQGISTAAEVDVKEVLDIDLDFVSVSQTQGVCKQKEALNIVVCHLGPLPAKARATITLVTRARGMFITNPSTGKPESSKIVLNSIEAVFKRTATDFVDERGQIFSQIKTTIVNER
ncbi:MAG TPA: hypothetical protein DC054_05615 [Blastocatellia bacterium]|nr:hypothetical protein [Blastocatellia bacterium]